jgi:hypothetical protein
VSRPASPGAPRPALLSVSRPASPGAHQTVTHPSRSLKLGRPGVPSDMGTVNYVDFDFELRGGDGETEQEGTDIIQPFVKEICEVSNRGPMTVTAQ